MYDIATQTVSKLRGELSSAFVEVAESNANSQELDNLADASDIVEQWKQSPFEVESGEEPLAASSEMYEDRVLPREVVDISTPATNPELNYYKIEEKAENDKINNIVVVSSGYSKTSDFTGPAV